MTRYRDKETGEVVRVEHAAKGSFVQFQMSGGLVGAKVWFWADEFRARFEPVEGDNE